MRPIDYFSESFDSLRKQKMCALLTMLDISVGVLTVMVTLGIGAGARIAIDNQIVSLGSNLVAINSGPPPSLGRQPFLFISPTREPFGRNFPRRRLQKRSGSSTIATI
jgi:hypothetical protein